MPAEGINKDDEGRMGLMLGGSGVVGGRGVG